MDNMIFTSEVCGVVLIAPFDKISRPPCSAIRFIVFLSLFFRCFSPFSFYHRTFSLTTVYNGATGFFSDILSYARLMALMLAGSVIAQVFNTLGEVSGSVAGFVIISLVGNALNFMLNLLGCYVHDLRLQCLEFFGRFYKEGGKPFRPLLINTKYVDIKEED